MSKKKGPAAPIFADTESSKTTTPMNYLSYVKPGVKLITPSTKTQFKGRILPDFDWDLGSHDKAFATSWRPYRIEGSVDRTGNPILSPFAMTVKAYNYFGATNARFISPAARYYLADDPDTVSKEDMADPAEDIIEVIENSDNPEWRALIERHNSEYSVISKASYRVFLNMYGYKPDENKLHNVVLDVSHAALYDLRDQLNVPSKANDGRDPDWSQYLLGDVTHPQKGLVTQARLIQVPGKYKFCGFHFQCQDGDGARDTLENIKEYPVGSDVLKNRYMLWGDNSVFMFYTYQQLVDYFIEDGSIPLELIKQACAHKANIGTPTSIKETAVAIPESNASKEPPVEKEQATKKEKFYFCDGSSDPVLLSREEVQTKLNLAKAPAINVYGEKTWYEKEHIAKLGFDYNPNQEDKITKQVAPPPPRSSFSADTDDIPSTFIPSLDISDEDVSQVKEVDNSLFEHSEFIATGEVSEEDRKWFVDATNRMEELSGEEMVRWANIDSSINNPPN